MQDAGVVARTDDAGVGPSPRPAPPEGVLDEGLKLVLPHAGPHFGHGCSVGLIGDSGSLAHQPKLLLVLAQPHLGEDFSGIEQGARPQAGLASLPEPTQDPAQLPFDLRMAAKGKVEVVHVLEQGP